MGSWPSCVSEGVAQGGQHPLIKEYSLGFRDRGLGILGGALGLMSKSA